MQGLLSKSLPSLQGGRGERYCRWDQLRYEAGLAGGGGLEKNFESVLRGPSLL